MPEGPEVRRAADRIEKSLKDKILENVSCHHHALTGLESELKGRKLLRVETYGKAFVLVFSTGHAIYVHLQLYGVWKTGLRAHPPKSTRALRLCLESEKHYARLYSATDIQSSDLPTIKNHPYIRKLGPDILNSAYGVGHISRRLKKKTFVKRTLGALLLDQSFFAGIGNYLRSEILFLSKLHPLFKPGMLTAPQRTLLARSIWTCLHRAYQTGGITTSPEYVQKSRDKGLRRRQYRHYVFSREGSSCPSCGLKITKDSFGGRRLYLCLQCQPSPK